MTSRRIVFLLTLAALLAACGGRPPDRRVIVLGFDGFDYGLARRLIDEGRLPNLARMERSGQFTPLETAVPPESPVAWSNFITGMDAGGHGIFDFVHRDPATLMPYASDSKALPDRFVIKLGKYHFPLKPGGYESLRRGEPFWKTLEDHGVEHYEEPCLYWELEQTKEVADALDMPVTGGEQDCEIPTWRRMIEMRAVDVVQPDILYLGGISRTLRVCRMAREAGLPVTPHSANLGLVTLFTMHLMRAIEGAGKYLEFSIEGADYYPWQEGLFVKSPYAVDGGHVTVSDEPGWGVEVDPEWLARSQYRVSERD